ncbi:hypothetical protein Skr01_23000 [Sphaerisporangium krabiense]|uniref:DNA-binding SARP family transcriptional activator n=1 Tax=Sphaerisporangium krabiense TaxID=763782 RepID=A0A7W8Z6A5_9ACTN|nr:AfsR/SARP family transcriptional regulator [Sphaerisporangium krabiense]MBB5628050.1 DNA-binding SARP family transcriptional activator [Sphaerisporangium krabiense]GII62215.1 hypothetical protein Skr01_23000 [Sphaerisporangium krabiense]
MKARTALRFGVLGSLEVTRDGQPVPVRAAKQRIALATLLLRAGQYVSVDQLIQRTWDGHAPGEARNAMQTHIARLRRTVGEDGQSLIHTHDDGYSVQLPPESLDLTRFRDLAHAAALAAKRHDLAGEARLLSDALALWRGPVLADVPSGPLHRLEIPQLVEERLRLLERSFDVHLRLGRHDRIVAGLKAATTEHPLHERLWAQLMLSLYRSGRRAEALETYRNVVVLLREELGIDPGHELARLHQAVLADDPDLAHRPD